MNLESVIISKRGKYGGTYAHPFIALKYMSWADERVFLWLAEIASENSSPREVCERIINKLKENPIDQVQEDMFLYLFHELDTNIYKIGISNDPERRLNDLQTGSSRKIELAAYIKCEHAVVIEQSLHDQLSKYRLRGEWFELPKHVVLHILKEWFEFDLLDPML